MKTLTKKENVLDGIDKSILQALDRNARLSVKALSRQVGLSAPGCGDRLRQLEKTVIRGYDVDLAPEALGVTLQALIRVKALSGQVRPVEGRLREMKECVLFFKVTGDDDFVCLMYLRSVAHLDELLRSISSLTITHTSLVKTVERKLPPL